MNSKLNILLDYHICLLEGDLLRAPILLLGLHHPLSVLGEGRVAEAQPAPVEAVPGPPEQKTGYVYVYCTLLYMCTAGLTWGSLVASDCKGGHWPPGTPGAGLDMRPSLPPVDPEYMGQYSLKTNLSVSVRSSRGVQSQPMLSFRHSLAGILRILEPFET